MTMVCSTTLLSQKRAWIKCSTRKMVSKNLRIERTHNGMKEKSMDIMDLIRDKFSQDCTYA